MSPARLTFWFWQDMLTPHMAGLVAELANAGCDTVYVASSMIIDARKRQGWVLPSLGTARLVSAGSRREVNDLIETAPQNAVHICQGIRGNGTIGYAQRALAAADRRQWLVMETVDDAGRLGGAKRFIYRQLFRHWQHRIEIALAIGHRTKTWVEERGFPAARVFSFAYFLPPGRTSLSDCSRESIFRFVFVGQLIPRKRLDLLLEALGKLNLENTELWIVGSGPEEKALRSLAEILLPGSVRWVGRLKQDQVPEVIAQADCLVLSSRHDGWGAVVSEALLSGVPAICSDACGAAGVVRASGAGAVFRNGDLTDLCEALKSMRAVGKPDIDSRRRLADWAAQSISASAGAAYLLDVIHHLETGQDRPEPPWLW